MGLGATSALSNPLVSVCVPTYNRGRFLTRMLASFEASRAALGGDGCQLCVSDNGSTDDTSEVLQAHARRHGHLKFQRQPENLGFGRNLYASARLAETDYIYFCGDDDTFRPESLRALLTFAAAQHDLVLCNSHPDFNADKASVPRGATVRLSSPADYFRIVGAFHASFIGNLFFRREFFLAMDPGRALGLSAYPHMVAVLQALARGNSAFANVEVVDFAVTERPWVGLQPVYTAVDLARVITENVDWTHEPALAKTVYRRLARSLPKAVWTNWRLGRLTTDNPYSSASLRNLRAIYRPVPWPGLLSAVLPWPRG